jgi:lipopolysaccharide biosynthesis glycosyltransferase
MSTEFAISRFLIPQLAGGGWALFADCDILVRGDLDRLFAMADSNYAVMCVKHDHRPTEQTKKDGRLQAAEHDPRFPGVYSRKNWSSVMLFNCDHSANAALTIELVNTVPGRDLHRFCWLDDALIGELPPEWNYLVGHTKLPDGPEPKLVHFTEGGPWLPKYAGVEYADDWRAMRKRACQQWGIPSAKIKAEAEAAS